MPQTPRLNVELYQAALAAHEQGAALPLPAEAAETEALSVLRALIDACGEITWNQSGLRLTITTTAAADLLFAHFENGQVQRNQTGFTLTWSGLIALDLLGGAMALENSDVSNSPLAKQYRELCQRIPEFGAQATFEGKIRVQRLHEQAVVPSKSRVSDSGYDVTLVDVKKRIGRTVLFGTGLIIEPPWGWYFDVVPRSSIIKTGYILANSVGVIDRAYRGELMVPLIKIDETAADLTLPIRAAQLIPRPIVHFPIVEADALGDTNRGAKGFGSSG